MFGALQEVTRGHKGHSSRADYYIIRAEEAEFPSPHLSSSWTENINYFEQNVYKPIRFLLFLHDYKGFSLAVVF